MRPPRTRHALAHVVGRLARIVPSRHRELANGMVAELDAIDGRPVHAILLLATPQSDRKRHLEVLAAFARAITHDLNLTEQLDHARSAAHAYEVLHADEAEDINYFIEDAMTRAGVPEDRDER